MFYAASNVTEFFDFCCSFNKKKNNTPTGLLFGSHSDTIPSKPLRPWEGEVCAAYTGPNTGLTRLCLDIKAPPSSESSAAMDTSEEMTVAGCRDWNTPKGFAYGISLSLYEEDRMRKSAPPSPKCPGGKDQDPVKGGPVGGNTRSSQGASPPSYSIVGDPIADVFGIVARENCCVMAMADGVNWGKKSRLAARCATHAVMSHVFDNMPHLQSAPTSTTVTTLLHEAVTQKAQELIIQHHATLTTLSAAVVCEMQNRPGEWGLFVCAVGDSPVYVYCPHTRQVVEATVGCHTGGIRDMRMAGGVLGPSFGSSPDLSNLTYAFCTVYPGDIVFAVSDGVSDNFSNKVMSGRGGGGGGGGDKHALKPCCENIPHLTRVLSQHQEHFGDDMTAQSVCACLINHSVEVTEGKRQLRVHCQKENIDMRALAARDPDFAAKLSATTGKLDHATVVAYEVGRHYNHSPYKQHPFIL